MGAACRFFFMGRLVMDHLTRPAKQFIESAFLPGSLGDASCRSQRQARPPAENPVLLNSENSSDQARRRAIATSPEQCAGNAV